MALNGGATRGWVLSQIVEDDSFKHAHYNSAFVLTQYFGYLRRDPDQWGYEFWLNVLNNGGQGNYRGMVCSFITSAEYQNRFSPVLTHRNADCSGIHGTSSLGNELLDIDRKSNAQTCCHYRDSQPPSKFVHTIDLLQRLSQQPYRNNAYRILTRHNNNQPRRG